MWKLAIEDEEGHRTVVNLVRDEYTIGRSEDNTVRLTERNVSRTHAKLSKHDASWILVDLNSHNGCFVNGARINGIHRLEHGDLLQIGDYRLEASDESRQLAETVSPVATARIAAKSQSLTGQPDRLVMLVGPAPGAEFPLVGSRLVLGRGEECDLQLNHSSVSRVHAEVHAIGDGRYEIIDRESANGVRINGVELKRSLLDARDSIELGDVVLKFIPAGEIFRPGVDDVQHIATPLAQGEHSSPAPGVEAQPAKRHTSSSLKMIAGVAGLGALALLGMITLRQARSNFAEQEAPVVQIDSAARALADAKVLLDRGELEKAHQKLIRDVPRGSNVRQSADFKAIESRWADAIFARAASEPDSFKRRALLVQISTSETSDSVRRKRALEEIAALDTDRVDVSDLPSATPPVDSAREAPPRVARIKPPRSTHESDVLRENPYRIDAAVSAGDADLSKGEPGGEPSPQPDRLARTKAVLQAKVRSGRATEQEIRALRALCRQLGDLSCSD